MDEANKMLSDKGIIKNIEVSIEYIKLILASIEKLAREEDSLTIHSLDKVKKIVIGIKILHDELVAVPASLGETYTIIKDIINHVHQSRAQLKGTVDGLIKKTGEQLSKVTSATEDATNKILDVSDQLTDKQNSLIEKLDEIVKDHPDLASRIEELKADIYEQQDDTFLILDYLQFQDITSQQLEAAFGLLNQIEDSLLVVAGHLEGFDGFQFVKTERRNSAYDANAEFVDKTEAQAEIDKLVKDNQSQEFDLKNDFVNEEKEADAGFKREKKDNSKEYSQSDIEVATNKPQENDLNSKGKVSQSDIDALVAANKPQENDANSGGKVSQADIDALVAANKSQKNDANSGGKVSQADIDALFSK